MSKLTILSDLDGIVVDLIGPWLEYYNNLYEDTLTLEDIHSSDMHKHVKAECGEKIYDFIRQDACFASLPAIPGALEGIAEIQGMGHEVVIVSTTSRNPLSAAHKLQWIDNNLKIDRHDIILTARKELVKGDMLIEDMTSNITKYRAAWPYTPICTIAYPYNNVAGLKAVRFPDHKNTHKAWEGIVQFVKDVESYRL